MIRIFVLVFVFHHATALMDLNEFFAKIMPKCFDDAMPRKPSSGLTLDNFIYLVEKFEEKYPERNIETNIKTLLKEFSCEGLKYPLKKSGSIYHGEREIYAEERKAILDTFMNGEDIAKLAEGDFTDDEICNLFFSLSHTVYESEIKPRPERKPDGQTNTTDETPLPDNPDQQGPVRAILEDGVVSFGGDETRAISLSDVLFGILGALTKKEKKINEILQETSNFPELNDKVLQSSFVFSLSAKITELGYHLKEYESIQLSAGHWVSTDCSKDYILKTNTEMFTYATLIGSVDGYLMGRKLLEVKSGLPKLSQLLRMYYSQQGFSSFLSKGSLSFCERGSKITKEDQTFDKELENQVYNYVLYYNLKKKQPTEIIKGKTEALMAKFWNEMPKASTRVNVESKKCEAPKEEVCETPSNVIVVLDKRNHFDTQLHTIAKLINNNGLRENTFRVFVNVEDETKTDMQKITDTVDANRIIASCALDEYIQDNAGILEENLVLQAINRTLMNIEQEFISLPGMPSKVVIYYNYGFVVENNAQLLRKIDDARRELINKHRGAEIYAVGENKENLKKFVPSLNVIDSRDNNLLETVEKKICSAPAEFQYLECKVRSKMDQEFLLHVNPDGVQYWQMQPKYFYKSFGYKLRFKPENGNIRVCFKRLNQLSKSGEGCQQTSETKREIEFVSRDPCKDFDAVTCNPFYFGIYGLDDAFLTECVTEHDNEQSSHKPTCRTPKQIKVTFNHEGLACSNAIRQIGSFYHYLLAIFAAFYIINRKS